MKESLAQRLKRLRKASGMSQAALADACGWSQSRVGNYEAGTREPSLADIAAMAASMKVDQSELLLDMPLIAAADTSGASAADVVRKKLAKNDPGLVGDEVWITHYDISAATDGDQTLQDYPKMFQDVRVSPSHLRELGVEFAEHEHLKMVTAWGQSMEPTIKHRDPLIVDVSINKFVGDGIYLFSWGEHIYIKRLQIADDDYFEMISDNSRHNDRMIRRGEVGIRARVLLVWNAYLV